jgi:PAS domain S-box-containing protein
MNELSPEKYRALIENTPLCVKVFDRRGNLIFINKGGRDEHKIADDQDVTKWDWMGTIKEEYREEMRKKFEQALAGSNTEIKFEHTPEGSDHQWCHGYLSPIKDDGGDVESVLFYSIDVSDTNDSGSWEEIENIKKQV